MQKVQKVSNIFRLEMYIQF